MTEIPKTCIPCKYFEFEPGEQGYSECTPGTNFRCYCKAGHFDNRANDIFGTEDYVDDLMTAIRCKDFAVSEYAQKIIDKNNATITSQPESIEGSPVAEKCNPSSPGRSTGQPHRPA